MMPRTILDEWVEEARLVFGTVTVIDEQVPQPMKMNLVLNKARLISVEKAKKRVKKTWENGGVFEK